MNPIPLDLAQRAAIRLARDADVSLAQPGDPRRWVVIHALAAVNGLRGNGWDYATAAEHVTVTLPGVGQGLELLSQVPYVGPLLRAVAGELEHPCIYLSPAAARDPVELLATMGHELGHVSQIRAGGLGWCLAYAVPEARAGGEAPCYGATMAVRHQLGGVPIDQCKQNVLSVLSLYGLDNDAHTLAVSIVESDAASIAAGEDPGGVVALVRAALVAEGWTP